MEKTLASTKLLDRPDSALANKSPSRIFDAEVNKLEAKLQAEEIQKKISSLSSVLQEFRKQNSTSKPKNLWKKFQHEYTNGGPPGFQIFRDKFTMTLNYVGIVLNTIAAIGSNKKIFPAEVAKFFDQKAEWFSRYIIPIGFGWNAIEALVGERPIEVVSRLIPAVSFWFLPFYNFNFTTGISSGINYLLELVKSRHGGLQPGKNMYENLIETSKTSYDIFKDMFSFKQLREKFTEQIATLFLLVGSIGGFFFARQDRDSFLAILFGNMRNLGGLVADKDLIFNSDKDPKRSFDKRLVGTSCITASALNILMRWVGPELARALTHITIAADDFGLTYWAQSSKRDNDAAKQNARHEYDKNLHLAV